MLPVTGQFCTRYKSEFNQLTYSCKLNKGADSGAGSGASSTIIFPGDSIKVHLKVTINTYDLLKTDASFAEELCSVLAKSDLWGSLGYRVQAYLTQDEIMLQLECECLSAIVEDIGGNKVSFFECLKLDFAYVTYSSRLQVRNLVSSLNYAVLSLVLHLENQFPFVFSVHSRKILRLNYKYLKEYIALMSESQHALGIDVAGFGNIVMGQMGNIMNMCISQYTTIGVLEKHTRSQYRVRNGSLGQDIVNNEEAIGRSMWYLKLLDYDRFDLQ